MVREPKVYRDGFTNFLGGINSGVNPSLVRTDQLAWAYNVTLRGGFAETRPGFNSREVFYPTSEIASWFQSGLFQGSIVYEPKTGQSLIIVSIAGRIFSINPIMGYQVQELTPTATVTTTAAFTIPVIGAQVNILVTDAMDIQVGYPLTVSGVNFIVISKSGMTLTVTNVDGPPAVVIGGGATVVYLDVNSPLLGKVWMKQAERFLIIQDGQSKPIIFDGSKVRRSNTTAKEVPVGTAMEYGVGRLWVAVNGNQFVAGDIVFGPTGTVQYNLEDSVLKFTENTYLVGGGAFNVPAQAKEITALLFAYVQNTATGQGPLMVFTENFVFSCDASPDRDTWQNTRSPIQTTVLQGFGSLSAQATISTTNGDIYYRAPDGMRSLILAVRDYQSFGNTPISTEMNRVLDNDTKFLLKFASAVQFDNRLLFTVQPVNNTYNAWHRGLGVLDFFLISGIGQKSPPAYDGIWTGIQPYQIITGTFNAEQRCFVFSRNADGITELWEVSKSDRFDNTDDRIMSMVESRSMYFGNAFEMKRLENAELWIDRIAGTVDMDLFFKEDQYPCWRTWNNRRQECSSYKTCVEDVTDCHALTEFKETYKTRLCFGQPPDTDDVADDKPSRLGYEFQFRIQWIGHCRWKKGLFKCVQVDEEPFPKVEDSP